MNCKLCDADRHAVDLLMERREANGQTDGNGGSSEPFASLAASAVHQRLNHLEQFLRVLDLMPASDPPQDLIDRTLRRVDVAVHSGAMPPAADSSARPSV